MNLKDTLVDSFKYTASNWFKIFLLGLVIFLADISNELSFFGDYADELKILVIIFGSILAFYELGFVFRIIEETSQGSNKMPEFNRILGTFLHGLKEAMIIVLYFVIPFSLILIGFTMLDVVTGPNNQEQDVVFILTGVFLGSLTYLLYQAAVLNMANFNGTIRSAFDFKRIFGKFQAIGVKRLVFIYILTVIFATLVEATMIDAKSVLPYGIGDVITSFLIAPFILIFIARTLGMINRSIKD